MFCTFEYISCFKELAILPITVFNSAIIVNVLASSMLLLIFILTLVIHSVIVDHPRIAIEFSIYDLPFNDSVSINTSSSNPISDILVIHLSNVIEVVTILLQGLLHHILVHFRVELQLTFIQKFF